MANRYAAVPYDYLEECEELTDEEFGRLIRGLLRYSRDGATIEAAGNERFFVRRVMNQEDQNAVQYANLAEKRKEAARHAALARWQTHERMDAQDAADTQNAGTVQNR